VGAYLGAVGTLGGLKRSVHAGVHVVPIAVVIVTVAIRVAVHVVTMDVLREANGW